MAELKTKKTEASVEDFIKKSAGKAREEDVFAIMKMMEKATGAKGKMWGPSIVGFGDQHLKYESGRELDWFLMGLSPRKANITLYIHDMYGRKEELLKKLGKHKAGKGCIYISSLKDVDLKVLKEIIQKGVK